MFDPASHSITEVLDYLAGAEPIETGRVLAAERTGGARPEILTRYPEGLGGRRTESPDA